MKDPAFLFYSKDWIEGTAEMMPEEKGVYIDLLAYQHQRGYLPSDTKRLARLVRMGVDEFNEIWKHISNKFERDGERTLNRKLEQVMNERADKGETNKIIGIFGHLCRNSEAKRSDVNKIRKEFKASNFKGIDSERLSERITEWFAERLASLEDVNEDVNKDLDLGNKEKKHKLVLWIEENAPRVQDLQNPITNEQAEKLKKDFHKDYIMEQFSAMDNYKSLLKSYIDANKTFRSWANRDEHYIKWKESKGIIQPNLNLK